jgi:hypothetical protein
MSPFLRQGGLMQIGFSVLALPEGMAFDEEGGLWMASAMGKFGRLAPAQLAASGTKALERVIAGADLGYAGAFAVFPAPAALPIFHRWP